MAKARAVVSTRAQGSEFSRVKSLESGKVVDPETFLAKAAVRKTVVELKKGETAFLQGDPADAAFYVRDGRLKVSVVSNAGKEAVIAILNGGSFIGEECLGGRLLRLATATAMSDCSLLRLEKTEMIRLLHQEPAFYKLFLSYLLSRTIRIEADLVDQLFNSCEKRLARVLLLLANFGKEGKPETVIAKISQETLAEIVGTTRSRVSFFMNKFRKVGFIAYGASNDPKHFGDGHLEIHSSLLNVVLHD